MKIKKIVWGSITIVAIILLFIIFFFWLQYGKLKPNYTENRILTNLQDTVSVFIDSSGVYHIQAANEEDLIRAQGYCEASERLWQMEMTRRIGLGKLSEVFGDTTLKIDRLFRTLDFATLIDRLYRNASPESKNWMQWYVEGVNQYIRESEDNLPIEFQLLRFKPELWKPAETFLVQRILAWILNYNWKTDFLYWVLQQKVSSSRFKDILPRWGNFPTIINLSAPEKAFFYDLWEIDSQFRSLLKFPISNWGSNSWVVSGDKTATGKPILANDPHLGLTLPSIWFEVVLESPEFRVAGFSIPGSPGIVIGRNENIAWGLTNGMIDDSDYFIEKIDTLNKTYLQNGKKLELKVKKISLTVKDRPVEFKTYWTHHGPILNTIFEKIKIPSFISLKWTAWDDSDELRTFYLLARARNWEQFLEALSFFKSPAQNFVYADKEGNIGYHLAGAVPIRPDNQGLFPRNGSDSANDWQGYVPFSKLPHIYNPDRGWIVTANNKIVDDYPFYLSEVWEPPFRATRIEQLLREKSSPLSVQDVQAIQMDTRSLLSLELFSDLKTLLQNNQKAIMEKGVENPREILSILEGWDGNYSRRDVVPAIIELWQWYLIQNIFEDEMGKELFDLFVDLPNFYQRIFYQIFSRQSSAWYDRVDTPDRVESREEILLSSFVDAISFLKEKMGDKPFQWEWGKLHTLYLKHTLGEVFPLNRLFNRGPFSVPGNGTTVNVATYNFKEPFGVMAGPSMRMIVDWSDSESYLSIFPGGNSGNVFSEFYDNQIAKWIDGKLLKIRMLNPERFYSYKYLLLPEK